MIIKLDVKYPTLNEYIKAERSNKYVGAKIKREFTDMTYWLVLNYKGLVKGKANIHFEWHVKGKHDPDNIDFARKFILDGMVKAGVLINDNQKYVGRLSSEVIRDKEECVIVYIDEIHD